MSNEAPYPQPASASFISTCDKCKGLGRIADDWCRDCGGIGYHGSGRTVAGTMELAEAISAAAGEIFALRDAAQKAALSFRALLPLLAEFPPEAEQRVRQALRALDEVVRG